MKTVSFILACFFPILMLAQIEQVNYLFTQAQKADFWEIDEFGKKLSVYRDSESVALIIRSLQDTDHKVRHCAIGALKSMKSLQTADAIIDFIGTENSRQNKCYECHGKAISALSSMGEDVIPFIKKKAPAASVVVRLYLITILGNIRSPEVIELLATFLNDESSLVQREAAIVLGKINDNAVVPPLLDALDNPIFEDKAYLIEALRWHNDSRIIGHIEKYLHSPNREIRSAAVGLFYTFKTNNDQVKDQIYKISLQLAHDNDSEIRKMSINYLLRSFEEKTIEIIQEFQLLADPNPDFRLLAIAALDKYPDKNTKAFDLLWPLTNDKNSEVRVAAYIALLKFDDKAKIPVVRNGLQDPYASVRKEVIASSHCCVCSLDLLSLYLKILQNPEENTQHLMAVRLEQCQDEFKDTLHTIMLRTPNISIQYWLAYALNFQLDDATVQLLLKKNDPTKTLAHWVANYKALILAGKPGSEIGLYLALLREGNLKMIEDFLNCGNTKLSAAAQMWASHYGYRIEVKRSGIGSGIRWGGK